MPYIDRTKIEELREKAERAMSRMSTIREKAAEEMGHVKTALEVNVAALGAGYAIGRWGGDEQEIKVIGVPVDLGLGLVGHVVSFAGAFGAKYAEDGHALSNGLTASFLARWGQKMGKEGASKSGTAGYPQVGYAGPAQMGPGNRTSTMDDSELSRVINMAVNG